MFIVFGFQKKKVILKKSQLQIIASFVSSAFLLKIPIESLKQQCYGGQENLLSRPI